MGKGNDSYWAGVRKAMGVDAAGNRIKPIAAPAEKAVEGTPLPGGGCSYESPGGVTITRLDVDCQGNPTQAALFSKGLGPPPGGNPSALSGLLGKAGK
jgi:hypothetical protein